MYKQRIDIDDVESVIEFSITKSMLTTIIFRLKKKSALFGNLQLQFKHFN